MFPDLYLILPPRCQIEIQLETLGDEEIGVIKKIMDRENYIVRKSVNLSKQTHIIAANVDLVFLRQFVTFFASVCTCTDFSKMR